MIDNIIKFLAGLLGVLLLGVGVRWFFDPAGAAALLGMEVLEGIAGNSQIGDLGAFFVVAGAFTLLGLATRNAALLYTPAALVGVAAVLRLVAGLVHGTGLPVDMIVSEVVMCTIFLLARKRIAQPA